MADLALDRLVPAGWAGDPDEPFQPCAKYFEAMDTLVYLEEDVAYRADRVDPFLTLLWHPDKAEAIGVKLKGFRYLFECLQEVAEGLGRKLEEDHFLPLIAALEMAMTAGLGAVITADAEKERMAERKAKYEKARSLVKRAQATIDPRELAKATS